MRIGATILVLRLVTAAAGQQPSFVPLHIIDNWAVIVEGTVGGIPHQRLLIDTGAVPSAINLRLARHLGLSGSRQSVSVMNRALDAERVRVPAIQIGPIAVDMLDMVALDFSRIERALSTRVDAIVGLDFFSRRNFSIDYRRQRLVFCAMQEGNWKVSFKTRHEAGGIYVVVPIEAGAEKLEVLLDTGTNDLMLFDRRLKGNLRNLSIKGQDATLNFGGNDRLTTVELQAVTIGPFHRKRQKAYVWKTSEANLRTFDGLLGPAALGATMVAFDFEHNLVSFAVP